MSNSRNRKKHSLKEYHHYFIRSGLYSFLWKNVFKFVAIIIVFVIALILLERYVIDIDTIFNYAFEHLDKELILLFFLLSETLMGLIPPDIFILWSNNFSSPFLMVTVLALLSYIGGILSYKLGGLIRLYPRINIYFHKKYDKNFQQVKKWGGIVIVFAALFPLPYSTICIIAGMLKYPLGRLALLGTTRLIRFYLYAIILFGVL